MENKKSFILHLDSLAVLDELSDAQVGKLFRAIRAYHLRDAERREQDDETGYESLMNDFIIRISFAPFKAQFKRDEESYRIISEKRKNAGKLGAKQKLSNANKSEQVLTNQANESNEEQNKQELEESANVSKSKQNKQMLANASKSKQTEQTLANQADSDSVSDSDNDISTNVDNISNSNELLCGTLQTHDEKINYKNIIDFFNRETKGVFGLVRYPISDTRKEHIRARIREHGKDAMKEVITKASKNGFLKGDNGKFRATFDWIILPTNFEKILTGNYDQRQKTDTGVLDNW